MDATTLEETVNVRREFVVCKNCTRVFVGRIYEHLDDGHEEIVPMGVSECPDCGGDDFSEAMFSNE